MGNLCASSTPQPLKRENAKSAKTPDDLLSGGYGLGLGSAAAASKEVAIVASAEPPRTPTSWKTVYGLKMAAMDMEAFDSLPTLRTPLNEVPDYAQGLDFNRYKDCLPNPLTRVMLSDNANDVASTYINANYIRSFNGRRAREYIATQGPLPSTCNQFIRMLWEQSTAVVVMLTELVDENKEKCDRYWPSTVTLAPDKGFKAGALYVALSDTVQCDGYVLNYLRISDGHSVHEVRHFWYNTWPEHGTPEGTDTLTRTIKILRTIRRHRQLLDESRSPMVVHCSAGIARTGALILIDQAMTAVDQKEEINLLDMILKARQDRGGLVQHVAQYKYVYQVTVEYAKNAADGDSHVYSSNGLQQSSIGSQSRRRPTTPRIALNSNSSKTGLISQSWFSPDMSRAQVQSFLDTASVGAFVVRQSSKANHFALSVKHDSKVANLLIVPAGPTDSVGDLKGYKLGESGKHIFQAVPDLIFFYMYNACEEAGGRILLRPIEENAKPSLSMDAVSEA